MKYYFEYFPYLVAKYLKFLLATIEDFENNIIKSSIKNQIIEPIFISGCPRSGTTILTHLISKTENIGCFQYEDIPFIHNLYLWNKINKLFYAGLKEKERVHGDSLKVGPKSPDSFEELFWFKNLSNHKENFYKILDEKFNEEKILDRYVFFISKMLYIKKKEGYLSKNNYNLFRIKLLKKIFPDLKFIICIRNPFETINSMVKVHNKFLEQSKKDIFFSKKLDFLCHYEFGKERKPFNLNYENYKKTLNYWETNDNHNGYLLQWIDFYNYLEKDILSMDYLKKNIYVVDNSEIYRGSSSIAKLEEFCNIKLEFNQNNLLKEKKSSSIEKEKLKNLKYSSLALEIYEKIRNKYS